MGPDIAFDAWRPLIALFGAFAAGLAAIPYAIAILKGHEPPYSTLIGWLLIGATGLFFHLETINPAAPRWSAAVPAVFVSIPALYLIILVIERRPWNIDRRDMVSLSGVVICWAAWIATSKSLADGSIVPLSALIATDCFASWPILQNAWRGKESSPSTVVSWALTAFSVAAGILAVGAPFTAEFVYPGYLFLMMGSVFFWSAYRHFWPLAEAVRHDA